MTRPDAVIVVITTAANEAEAVAMSDALLGRRLAACVQIIGNVQSSYWWRGRKHSEKESLMLIKTRRSLYGKIEAAIRKIHKYENPEIVAVAASAAGSAYSKWLFEETAASV